MLKFFRLPFANAGDKTAVPDAVDSNGNVSYEQGYGFDYQRQKTDPAAKNIERDKMNQIFFDLTTAIAEMQAQGVPDFITTALNGGAAYSYGLNAVVKYGGELYISLQAANTALPTDSAKWAPFSSILKSLGVTPPQFDNDTSLATTEFVQRALGSKSGYRTITATVTLTAADIGKQIIAQGSAMNITLPLLSTLVDGAAIEIQSQSSASVSILAQGSDLISANSANNALGSVSIADGESIFLVRVSATKWGAVSGAGLLKYAASFGASLASSGYQKLPSGLIIQWGAVSVTSGSSADVTLPITFPNGLLRHAVGLQSVSNLTAAHSTGGQSLNTSTLRFYYYSTGGGSGAIEFIAIGR